MIIPWAELKPVAPQLPAGVAPAPTQGGMGIVLRGTWRPARAGALSHAVAVKVLKAGHLASASQASTLELLQREAAAMRAASDDGMNEYVAQLYGVASGSAPAAWVDALGAHASACLLPDGSSSGGGGGGGGGQCLALVMRWEEGGSLHELLHSPTLAWGAGTAERLLLCARIASGVGALHCCGSSTLIHGDIKPANVLLSHAPGAGGALRPRICDFGFAQQRSASVFTTSQHSAAAATATAKLGTLPYMAPEMLLEDESGKTKPASRSTDVYALGVLCWEVLCGRLPWEAFTEQRMIAALMQAQARGGELPRGVPLTSPPLPVDTPAEVKAVLEACLGAARDARPRVDAMAEALHQAAQTMASGEFDVFLSHAWGADGRHAPLTTEVYLRLIDAGLRVWLDTAEMGADPTKSMQKGIRNSKCVVALLNERYGTRPNCLRELTWAKEMSKPVVGCLAEPQKDWFLGEALRALLPPDTHLFPDLRVAAGVDWGAGEGVTPAQRELLTKAPEALPKVLRLVGLAVEGGGGGESAVAAPEAAAAAAAAADAPAAVAAAAAAVAGGVGAGGGAAALAEPAAATAAAAHKVKCLVCLEEVPEADCVRCKTVAAQPQQQPQPQPQLPHLCCRSCLQVHVKAHCTPELLMAHQGGIPCVHNACPAPPWHLRDLGQLSADTATEYAKSVCYVHYDLPRIKREEKARLAALGAVAAAAAGALVAAQGTAARAGALHERVRALREQILERDLTLRCPRCSTAYEGIQGCAAVKCTGWGEGGLCGAAFCAYCSQDCGKDAHEHVRAAHAGLPLFPKAGEFLAALAPGRCAAIAGVLRAVAGEGRELQEALLGELAVADLGGVGVSAGDVRAAAGMGAAGAAAGQAGSGACCVAQ
jgi:serine/threonine protein kinase